MSDLPQAGFFQRGQALIFDDSVDEKWTDGVVGLGVTHAFSKTTSWSTQVDVSAGES